MQIVGTFTAPQVESGFAPSDAELKRLGLQRVAYMSEKRPDGESTFYLFADQGLIIHPPGTPAVILNRTEVAQLYTFLTCADVLPYVLAFLRAQILEESPPTTRRTVRRLMRLLDTLPLNERHRIADVIDV